MLRLEQAGFEAQGFGRELPSGEQLRGTQVLYHCAGIAHRAASEADYEEYNYRATLDLAGRAESAGVSRFVFLSSVNAEQAADSYGYWKYRTE